MIRGELIDYSVKQLSTEIVTDEELFELRLKGWFFDPWHIDVYRELAEICKCAKIEPRELPKRFQEVYRRVLESKD